MTMTITREQLDEIEGRVKVMRDSSTPFGLFEPDKIDRLVAVYRAALAWRDARMTRQAAQVRAGTAETSDEYRSAAADIPAAKEADILACMALLAALEGT